MTTIERFSSGAPWEPIAGYSRTVRAGDRVLVAGTTATLPGGGVGGVGDPVALARRAKSNVEAALALGGATLADVVRTRWGGVARARGGAFGAPPPVTAMVQVAALIDPQMLVEIEAEAVTAARDPAVRA